MILLTDLLERAGVVPDALHGNCAVGSIEQDSRQVTTGSLFVCMPGHNANSHDFIPAAKQAGAVGVIAHSREGLDLAEVHGLSGAMIRHDGSRFNEALCKICREYFHNPTCQMKVVGVTGTNGKTTTAWLVRDIFRNLGERAAYLGTLGFHTPDEQRELSNTTPNPVELYKLLAEARDKSVDVLAMEVSSHALAERRAEGVEYDAVVFTNLTQDHLDFHGSMEDYESAKSRLFIELPEQTEKTVIRCLNMDDPVGESWFEKLGATDYLTFSSADSSWDVYGGKVEVSIDRIGMDLYYSGGREFDQPLSVRAPLGGYFNVENLLAAITAALACGVPYNDLLMPLQNVRPVPGRFEPVQNSSGIGIIVDYAHTPDALAKVLDTARELTRGRLTCVFGCGGDRDRTKRPLMGAAASERADVCVLTSDNPRTEDPEAILRDVERGIRSGSDHVTIIDRREAVAHAIADAKPGDTVVIAGKGHENYQIIGRTKYPMDDRSLAREALEARCAR